jgi:hypothetical protein
MQLGSQVGRGFKLEAPRSWGELQRLFTEEVKRGIT